MGVEGERRRILYFLFLLICIANGRNHRGSLLSAERTPLDDLFSCDLVTPDDRSSACTPQSASPSWQGRTAEGTSPSARSFFLGRCTSLHKEVFARMLHFFARRIGRPHFALSEHLLYVLTRLSFLKPPNAGFCLFFLQN